MSSSKPVSLAQVPDKIMEPPQIENEHLENQQMLVHMVL